jgi:excinuclease UvrABC nuclease subunit
MSNQLYRHFDANGTLLYVGMSLNALNRLIQHRQVSLWFDEIANITIEKFETKDQLIEAEMQAIKTESPKYNIIHSDINKPLRKPRRQKTYLEIKHIAFKKKYASQFS